MVPQRSDGGTGKRRHLRPVEVEPGGTPPPDGRVHVLEEFLVDYADGTPFGIVEQVVEDGYGRVIGVLVALDGLGRRKMTSITPDEIFDVDPLNRRIVVSRAPQGRRRRWWHRD